MGEHSAIREFFGKLSQEPPFRLFSRLAVKYFGSSIRSKANWDAVSRPHYLVGTLQAADQALRQRVKQICVIEFGVAAGAGLLALQEYAAAVEQETGVKISVYGFDTGKGIPTLCGDHRDHPDQWRPCDYPMNEGALRSKLTDRTTLVIGNVADTVAGFVRQKQNCPIGFVSFDLDLYSSTVQAFDIFNLPEKRMLHRTFLYFDDVDFVFNHKFAGELLAIDEFNRSNASVKIDEWRGLSKNRVFPENSWLKKMYVAHDLAAISAWQLDRQPAEKVT
jgi:hypothetical protein